MTSLYDTRATGQLFMMGFDGSEVTPQIKQLIEKHHLGTILLTAKNLKCGHPTETDGSSLIYPQRPNRQQSLFWVCKLLRMMLVIRFLWPLPSIKRMAVLTACSISSTSSNFRVPWALPRLDPPRWRTTLPKQRPQNWAHLE